MVFGPVNAGTVLFLDFDGLGFAKPEMAGGHPVVVVSPRNKQMDGTAIVVPLTSEIGNWNNADAVEITNQSFVAASPTGRSFAVCDKPIAVALDRLKPFETRRARVGRNHMPSFVIDGEDLANIRLAMFRAMCNTEEFNRLFSERKADQEKTRMLIARLRARQAKSRAIGRAARKKPGRRRKARVSRHDIGLDDN